MSGKSKAKGLALARVSLGLLFVVAGTLHFSLPRVYLRIMPPYLPCPLLLVYISGAAEMLGGIGLFMPRTRRAASWGLVALLVAVWPANIWMAMAHLAAPGIMGESWAQWTRVPLQVPLMLWVWWCGRTHLSDDEAVAKMGQPSSAC